MMHEDLKPHRLGAFLAFCFLVVGGEAYAQEHESHHEEAHKLHANTLGLFLGETFEGSEEAFTLGLEYERRLSESFGIGLLVEHVFGDLDFWVYGVPLAFHMDA